MMREESREPARQASPGPWFAEEVRVLQPEWLGIALDSIGDAVIVTDPSINVTFLNALAQAWTGWTQEEAAGIPLHTVFTTLRETSRQSVVIPALAAIPENAPFRLEDSLLIDKDGGQRPIDGSAAAIRDAEGNAAGAVVVFRDLTERRRMQEEIAALTRFPEENPTPAFRVDANGIVLQANAASAILPCKPQAGEPLRCCECYEPIFESLQTGQSRQVDLESEGRAFALVCVPVGSEYVNVFSMDITERKRWQYLIQESELRFRSLFRDSAVGMIVATPTGVFLHVNQAFCEFLGYSEQELLGNTVQWITHPDDWEASLWAMREVSGPCVKRFEKRYLHKSGQVLWGEVNFSPVCDPLGKPQYFITQVVDISERKRAEEILKAQAKKLADADRRKDEFLAMLSHELRNPLAPIVNGLHILRSQGGDDPHEREARSVIERQVGHLAHLVNDLLEVSRISTGRVRLQLDRVAFNGIVERAVETVQHLANMRHQTVSLSLPEEPIWLEADPNRLEQVVGNLLNNAAKYTSEGGHIWIALDREGAVAVLRVRDDGIGIVEDLLPHIFGLFMQADKSLDRSEGGLGIGLALVKSLVEIHRGTVEAHSAGVNKGSEFVVRLPTAVPGTTTPEIPQSQPLEATPSRRVLVVDDSVDAAKTTAMLLEEFGHAVRLAHSGEEALEVAVDFMPDVILLDIGLPGMDGYEVARRFREELQMKDIRLVAVTGYGQDSDRDRSQAAGMDDHLVKPVDPYELLRAIAGQYPAGKH